MNTAIRAWPATADAEECRSTVAAYELGGAKGTSILADNAETAETIRKVVNAGGLAFVALTSKGVPARTRVGFAATSAAFAAAGIFVLSNDAE